MSNITTMYISIASVCISRREMRPKWYNVASEDLDEGEVIEKTYEIELDGNYGFLILTNQKLKFIKQEGFFRKKYIKTLETGYDEIDEIGEKKNRFKFTLSLKHHPHTYNFQSNTIPVSIVVNQIKERTSINVPIPHMIETVAQQVI